MGSFLEFLDLLFGSILPRGVRFCGLLLTASILKFLVELAKVLFF